MDQTTVLILAFLGGLVVTKIVDAIFASAKEKSNELKDNTIAVIKLTGRIEALEGSLNKANIPKMQDDLNKLWTLSKKPRGDLENG